MARKKIEVDDNEKMKKIPTKKATKSNTKSIKQDENETTINDTTKKENISFYTRNKSVINSVIITLVSCFLLFGIFYEFYLKNLVIETTKLVKDVTVTDSGIADAVEKVYDSVVVVNTYVRESDYASGTGFVYKTDDKYGYIITNNHVIANSTSIKVTFSNNKKYDVKVVGKDEYADIAVLAVEKDAVLSVATIGSSEKMRVGDTTFAVGAPVDSTIYSWSVTRGILSGKNRVVEVSDYTSSSVINVLQTDTAINSGNSGGPLCNSNGEVVGVTNMKLSSAQVEGMGFAIPIEEAIRYADSMITGEKISRPYLGVSIYDSNGYFGIGNGGVYIEGVEKGSAAEKAGLQKNDKILKVNDTEITSTSYFKYELYKYNVGDKIKITIERNKKEKVIEVVLGSNSQIN